MPNWKKLIVSGSDATLNSLNVTNGITGSLYGTASWAQNSITSSFVTASNVFGPFGSNSVISASYATFSQTASYALNGGVTQILAGPNITVSPINGRGQVTISTFGEQGPFFNTATGSYGSFYDTTTQINPVANAANSMSFNETAITNGVSISGSVSPFNSYIKTENAGVYNIQFSAQIDKIDGGEDNIDIWIRKNGTDLIDTATALTLPKNNNRLVAAWNWFVQSAANDYYQIIWKSADTSMRLLAEVSSSQHPGIPSVILTANRVDQFLSNTGSFNGTFTGEFTGSLFGTASYATFAASASQAQNAVTASYALTAVSSSVASSALSSSYALTASHALTVIPLSLQQVVNTGNGIANFGGNGVASIQSTNFTNNRTLYLNDNSYPTIRLVDNNNASNNLQIDIDTLTLDNVSYNWSNIVSGGGSTNTGSLLTTGSVVGNVLTFTKGDSTTFTLTVATGSGGGGGGATATHTQAVAANTWTFNHNLNTLTPLLQVYDLNYEQIIPNEVVSISAFTSEIRFDYTQAGYAVASTGGGLIITGSTAKLVQTVPATTWSFAHNLGTKYPGFEVFNENDDVVIPAGIHVVDENNAEIYFALPSTGVAIANFSGVDGAFPFATSASFAATSSYSDQFNIGETQTRYATVASSISGSNIVFTQSTGSYTSAFFKYTVGKTTNARSGEIMAVWNGSTVAFTDNSTTDIGSTTPVTASVVISGANIRLNVQTNTSGWKVKSIATFM